MIKAIIFARVSTEEQKKEGFSLPAQLVKMRDYCKTRGLSIKSEHEIDESSTKDERKKFEQIIEEIKESKEKIALVNETIDRLQRSFRESVVLDDLRKQDKVEIHFLRENLVISVNSNSSDLIRWDMGVMFARSYVLQLSDNVKRSIDQKLRNKEWPGKAPYGYKNITAGDDKKDIVIDEFASKVVKKIYELYSTGAYSMLLIRNKLEKDYNIKFSKSKIDAIMNNPFYYGVMRCKGKLYPHRYEPIITKELFDKVQEVKSGHNKKRFKYAGHPYIYRGLIPCADCGCMVTPEKHKGHVYYHCTQYRGKHGAKWLREEDITKQFAKVFKKLQIPQVVLDDITGSLKNVHKGKSEFREERYKKLTKEKEKYTKRIESIYIDKIDGSITKDEYDKFYTKFREKIDEIDGRLTGLQKAEDEYYITASYLLELASKAHDLFMSSEIEEKRQLIKLTLQNLSLKDRKVQFQGQKPFDTILKFADSPSWLRQLELVRTFFIKQIITPSIESELDISLFPSGEVEPKGTFNNAYI